MIVPAHEIILHVHVFIKHLHMQLLAGELGKDHLRGKQSHISAQCVTVTTIVLMLTIQIILWDLPHTSHSMWDSDYS